MDIILYGTKGEKLDAALRPASGQGHLDTSPLRGSCNNLERRYRETHSDSSKRELEELMSECPCPDLPRQAAAERAAWRSRWAD